MSREVEPASAPLRGAGLAAAVCGHARGAEPVIHVVRAVDLLAHTLAHGFQVGRRGGEAVDHLPFGGGEYLTPRVAHPVEERRLEKPAAPCKGGGIHGPGERGREEGRPAASPSEWV